jgi:hypothetical protein
VYTTSATPTVLAVSSTFLCTPQLPVLATADVGEVALDHCTHRIHRLGPRVRPGAQPVLGGNPAAYEWTFPGVPGPLPPTQPLLRKRGAEQDPEE